MSSRFVGPRGPRPSIRSWRDLENYRDEQEALMELGKITPALYRRRLKRECRRYELMLRYAPKQAQSKETNDAQ